ncbi:hypothetical protein [Paenibacillus sp. Soil522]|uniref:hypothetical protein n=1 Tax=Paenibacillus sp. Soil522 TaxID=1736388 RepID=UPI0006FE95FD|nr:hypothetical protein [Paenibacillus sp. Soil522]KRE48812.1 hypothetical protein ASG81_06355 [Paenibacillus sp. Soil522]
MEPIFPLDEEVVNRYCGYPVCVVMNDGRRHVGILSSCGGGKLLLNSEAGSVEANVTQIQPKVSKKKKGGKGKSEGAHKSGQPNAQTQSYPYDPYYYGPDPYYPWGGALALDFALVAFLFLLL